MTTNSTAARERAEAAFQKKERQLAEGRQAMAEYEARGIAEREKTARLRALRLAREAGEHDKAASASEAQPDRGHAKRRPARMKRHA